MSAPVQGSGSGFVTADLKTELDARNVDLTHMNRLDENVSAAKQGKVTKTTGTFVLADNTTEQDVLELLLLDEKVTITLDLDALTQTNTLRVYEKVDGTTYRKISENTDADFTDAAEFTFDGKGRDMKITMQASVGEGATRNIPHARVETLRAT